MLGLFLALLLITVMHLVWVVTVRLFLRADNPLHRVRRRLDEDALVRRAVADLDREHASLIDEHRRTP